MTTDSGGRVVVAGRTKSSPAQGFPVVDGPRLTLGGGDGDAFVAKLKSDQTGFASSGYLGGSGGDLAAGVAVDPSGNTYVAGATSSPAGEFPVAGGPDLTFGGNLDAFVAKVSGSTAPTTATSATTATTTLAAGTATTATTRGPQVQGITELPRTGPSPWALAALAGGAALAAGGVSLRRRALRERTGGLGTG